MRQHSLINGFISFDPIMSLCLHVLSKNPPIKCGFTDGHNDICSLNLHAALYQWRLRWKPVAYTVNFPVGRI